MTSPLRKGVEPGPGEFSWGKGLLPPRERGAVYNSRQMLGTAYQTDPANPEADLEGTLVANPTQTYLDSVSGVPVMGDLEEGMTPRVREVDPSKPSGINPSKYNPGHYPDGIQDGSGAAWRATLPPNPVT